MHTLHRHGHQLTHTFFEFDIFKLKWIESDRTTKTGKQMCNGTYGSIVMCTIYITIRRNEWMLKEENNKCGFIKTGRNVNHIKTKDPDTHRTTRIECSVPYTVEYFMWFNCIRGCGRDGKRRLSRIDTHTHTNMWIFLWMWSIGSVNVSVLSFQTNHIYWMGKHECDPNRRRWTNMPLCLFARFENHFKLNNHRLVYTNIAARLSIHWMDKNMISFID